MQAAAASITSAFDKASGVIGKFGGIAAAAAGGFAVTSSIIGANRYLRTVRDIGEATGYAYDQIDGILEAMQTVNIGAMEAQNAITVMSVKMSRYRMEVERTGSAQSDSARIIKQMGITARMGPEESFKRMATLAKQNKLGLSELVIGFEMERTVAAKLIRLLQQGPENITRIMDSLRKRGIAVTADNIEAFAQFERAQIGIRSAWDRIFIVVAGKVYPIITSVLDKVAKNLDTWSVKASEWGKVVADFLDSHLSKLILIGKVMAANFAMQKAMGFGMGEGVTRGVGRIQAAGGRFMAGGGERASAAYAARYAATWRSQRAGMTIPAEFAPSLAQKVAHGFKPVSTVLQKASTAMASVPAAPLFAKLKGIPSLIVSGLKRVPFLNRLIPLFAAMGPPLAKFGMVVGKFSAIGIVIAAIIGLVLTVYNSIRGHFDLFREVVTDIFTKIQVRAMVIWKLVKPVFDAIGGLFSANGAVGQFFTSVLLTAINMIGMAVDGIMNLVQIIIIMVKRVVENPRRLLSPLELFTDAAFEAQRLMGDGFKKIELDMKKPPPAPGIGVPVERQKQPYNDFRGSRFDIKQSFAEGFDPDRIAVAFSNDLATLGERKVQSALAPIGVVR